MKEHNWQKWFQPQSPQKVKDSDVLEKFEMGIVDVDKLKEWLELPVVHSKKIKDADGQQYELIDIGGEDDKDKGVFMHLMLSPPDNTVLLFTELKSDETYSVGYVGGGFKVKKVEFVKRKCVSKKGINGIEKSIAFSTAGRKRQQTADFSIIFWGREA